VLRTGGCSSLDKASARSSEILARSYRLAVARSLHILFAAPAYWPAVAFGGPIWMARGLLEGAVERGHRVDVVTTSLRAIGEPPAHRARSATRLVDGVVVHQLATPLRYRWMGVTPSLPVALERLPRPDVVHVFGFRDVVTTVTAHWARLRGIPWVFEPLDMFVPQFRNVPLKRGFDAALGRPVATGARVVVANSERERRQVVALGIRPDRVVVRPNGFPAPHAERSSLLRARLGIGGDVPLVLNVGRISYKKGLDLLFDAVAQLPGAHVAVVGPDDGDGTRERLEAAAASPALAGRAHLVPPFDVSQPRALYGEADVFVLPSRNESFGMVAAEAAAAGVASVVTSECGAAELLRDAALVVPPETDSIRDAIARLLADPELRRGLGAAGRAVAAELSWAEVARRQEEIYLRALA
jgi:glycosyltransferase involved in cell wall biosynthesis